MKKLLWIIFLIGLVYIFDITVSANEDYTYLLDNPNENGFVVIDVDLNYKDLIDVFEKNDVSLISVLPKDNLHKKFIRLEGDDIHTSLDNGMEKFTDILIQKGFGEKAMNYKVNGFYVEKIKVFGKNKEIYSLVEDLHFS